MATDVRELLRQAQVAEISGEKARARELLDRAAQVHEADGLTARAEQLRRHIERLGEGPPVKPISPELSQRGPMLAAATVDAWCSFCCRPGAEVGPLVQAPVDAFICRKCLVDSAALLGTELAAPSTGDASDPVPPEEPRDPRAQLESQAGAVRELERRLSSGVKQRGVLFGPAGSGKSFFLKDWAKRGLGEYIPAKRLLRTTAPTTRTLLVDDVELLEASDAVLLAERLGDSFLLSVRGAVSQLLPRLGAPLFPAPLFTSEELARASSGRLSAEVLERVESVFHFTPLTAEDLVTLARAHASQGLDARQLEALAAAALTSPRGAHELIALLRRAERASLSAAS